MRYKLLFESFYKWKDGDLLTVDIDHELPITEITGLARAANVLNTVPGKRKAEFSQGRLLRDLCLIDGVESIITDRYRIYVRRASDLFEWDPIVKAVLYNLEIYFEEQLEDRTHVPAEPSPQYREMIYDPEFELNEE